MRSQLILAYTGIASAAVVACAAAQHQRGHEGLRPEKLTRAIAVLSPTTGNVTSGMVTFVQERSEVVVTVHVTGLQPNSVHAWHIHEYGDISGLDGETTGGHYNPEGHPHALPSDPDRHAGDLGNLTADASGQAHKVVRVRNITIGSKRNPIIGRGVIIHAKADDGGQPTGNAGSRIAQGVIGIAKPK